MLNQDTHNNEEESKEGEDMETNPFLVEDFEDEEELSYAEILASAIFNNEIIITIPLEEEERVKNGLKNYKNKQITKAREEGLPVDLSVLIFDSRLSKEFTGCIDLSIQSKNRGTVKIRSLKIPKNDLPD